MKFYMIHLMPFADLDLDYDKKYNSAWVTLPNSYYDPKKGTKLYNRYLDELVLADELGFDGVCVQRASSERLRPDADPGRHRGRARARNQALQDRGARPRAAAADLSAQRRRGIRDARQHLERPPDRRLRARHRRRISLDRRQSGRIARPLPRSARPDPAGLDRARPVRVTRASTITSNTSTPGRARSSSRIRRSGFPRRAAARRSNGPRIPSRKYTYLQTFSPVDQLARFMGMYQQQAEKYGYEAVAAAARLGNADLCQRHRRSRAARSAPAHRGVLQQVPAHAGRDAVAARLPLARLDGGGRRQDPRRGRPPGSIRSRTCLQRA